MIKKCCAIFYNLNKSKCYKYLCFSLCEIKQLIKKLFSFLHAI